MRWLFVLLVLANAAIFGWFYQQQQTNPKIEAPSIVEPSEGQQLILRSEAKKKVELKDSKEQAKPKAQSQSQEPQTAAIEAQGQAKAEPKKAEPLEEKPLRCYRSTPFNEQIDARLLAAKIKKLGYQASIDTVKSAAANMPTKYWVYVPKKGTPKDMQKIQATLKKKNFDTFLITKGKLAGAISLGIYRSKKSAVNLEKDVARFRIPVATEVLDGSQNQYSVVFFTPVLPDSNMLKRLQEDKQDIRWRRIQCPL